MIHARYGLGQDDASGALLFYMALLNPKVCSVALQTDEPCFSERAFTIDELYELIEKSLREALAQVRA